MKRTPSVYLDTMGCAKNLVDSESALGLLQASGFRRAARPNDADLVVVNTCGFLATAREESLARIRALAAQKNGGKLVVMGCLIQGGSHDVQALVPGVDAVLGVGEYHRLAEIWGGDAAPALGAPEAAPYMGNGTRVTLTPPHVAYLKIAEGCNQNCTFCRIPALRGRQRSRPVAALVEEAQRLVDGGARELILIAQNSSAYGVDLPQRPRLPELCAELGAIEGVDWIRVMYAFPPQFSAKLAAELYAQEKVASYLDIPIQHASPAVLARMERGYDVARLRRQLSALRALRPGIMLRTTALVGFPGETEEDFVALLDFLAEVRFEHLGSFVYSHEPGTRAFALDDDVELEVKADRAARVHDLQWDIALERKSALLAQRLPVVVDTVYPSARASGVSDLPIEVGRDPRAHWRGPVAFGRAEGFGYGCDGGFWFPASAVGPGDVIEVEAVACGPYDLLATTEVDVLREPSGGVRRTQPPGPPAAPPAAAGGGGRP